MSLSFLLLLPIFAPLFVICQNVQQTIIQFNSSDSNGAKATIISSEIDTSNGFWDFHPNKTEGFMMELELNNNWGLDDINPSRLTIEIQGEGPSEGHINLNKLIFSFDIDNKEYFNVGLRMDNIGENKIYPRCAQTLQNAVNISNGYIVDDMDNDDDNPTRWSNAKLNLQDPEYNFKFNSNGNDQNQWDLKFIIEHNPTITPAITTFKYTNTHQQNIYNYAICYFKSLTTNKGLNLYITSADMDTDFRIVKFKLQYQVISTTTSTPTNNPITSKPTTTTDYHTTNIPTANPSSMVNNPISSTMTTVSATTTLPGSTSIYSSTIGLTVDGNDTLHVNTIEEVEEIEDGNSQDEAKNGIIFIFVLCLISICLLLTLPVFYCLYRTTRSRLKGFQQPRDDDAMVASDTSIEMQNAFNNDENDKSDELDELPSINSNNNEIDINMSDIITPGNLIDDDVMDIDVDAIDVIDDNNDVIIIKNGTGTTRSNDGENNIMIVQVNGAPEGRGDGDNVTTKK